MMLSKDRLLNPSIACLVTVRRSVGLEPFISCRRYIITRVLRCSYLMKL